MQQKSQTQSPDPTQDTLCHDLLMSDSQQLALNVIRIILIGILGLIILAVLASIVYAIFNALRPQNFLTFLVHAVIGGAIATLILAALISSFARALTIGVIIGIVWGVIITNSFGSLDDP